MRSKRSRGSNSLRNTSSGFNMVVFNQHPIAQTEAMVLAPTQAYGLLLQATQARSGLTRIQDTCLCSLKRTSTMRSQRGNAREASQEVQCHTLSAQDRASRALNTRQHIALLHMSAILDYQFDRDPAIKQAKG